MLPHFTFPSYLWNSSKGRFVLLNMVRCRQRLWPINSRELSVRELWGSHQGCQVPFCTSGWNVGLLLIRCSGQGPHLAMTGQSRGFSRPEGTGNPKRAGWAELPRTCANSSSIPGQTPDSVLVCRVAGGGCRGRKGRGASRGYYTDRSQTEKGKSHMIPCVLSHFSHVQLYATLGTIARQATMAREQ